LSQSIKQLIQLAHGNAVNHGWWENPPTFGDLLSLVHEEVSETLGEHRNGKMPTETYYSGIKKFSATDTKTKAVIAVSNNIKGYKIDGITCTKPEGIPSELADVVIRIFDICGYYGIDLQAAIEEKMAYNESRPYKHGGKILWK